MKLILTLLLLLVSIFLALPSIASEYELPRGDFAQMRKMGVSQIVEIVNPLTIKLKDGRIIHLAGLDFPDLDYYDPGDLSVTALEILNDFLVDNDVAVYQTKSPKQGRVNRMGHHISHLVRVDNDVWVQGLLLSLGVSRVRTTQYNPDVAKQMYVLENQAREEKLGLWGMDNFKTLTPDKAHNHIGSFQVVEGVIKSVSMLKNRIYLNFGNNWRNDFTVSISAFHRRKFLKQKIDLKNWNGKRVRVRGWIRSYNGPYMEINHPERFEIVFEERKDNATPKTSIDKYPPAKTKAHTKVNKGNSLPVVND